MRLPVLLTAMLSFGVQASSNMQAVNGFLIDRTEVSIAEFSRFAAETGFISSAERAGGGECMVLAGSKSWAGLGKCPSGKKRTLSCRRYT